MADQERTKITVDISQDVYGFEDLLNLDFIRAPALPVANLELVDLHADEPLSFSLGRGAPAAT